MPSEKGWYYVGRATQGRGHIMIHSPGFEERYFKVWFVLRRRRPGLRRERRITKVCCDEAVPPLGQVWVFLRRTRPPTGEEHYVAEA